MKKIGNLSKFYAPKAETKDYNVLIDGKSFFGVPVKNKEEAYETIIDISKKLIAQLVIY